MSVVQVLLGLLLLPAVAWWGFEHGLPNRGKIDVLLLLLFSEWISTFCHELGHAVAGWGVDMTLSRFAVGPFVAQKRAGRWNIQLSLASMLTLGDSMSSNPLHLKDLRRRMVVEIAAGPAASFLTALVAFTILLAAPG
jgi:membrane-associated protease RseP (regulator of RpoE activity)